ncbi:MAG: L-seryl-tRNA(Sec) selenium transferase [Acidimicrobiia bacterium]|nr:L-seryl-tRNA(Sec) selenium transferase [Acidimicrobiia bacterium]
MGRLCHMELHDLPRVDAVARQLESMGLVPRLATVVARESIDQARNILSAGGAADPIALATATASELLASRPARVINATGVLLHTNLGRATLHIDASRSARAAATEYGNIELDATTGTRGGRASYAGRLLTALTGAEAALVVNNNAAALLLALAALAAGRNAVVSRGEEIEIGGSFRLPELMEASGARLVEVGTTNRTRLSDYAAVAAEAAAILKVHPSNYRLEGFAESVDYAELAALAADAGVPFIADVGSGLLDTRVPWLPGTPPPWLGDEPGVRQTLEAGADLVLFSGDKLLGGPQAGIAVGRAELVEKMRTHPLARAVRIDGPTHAALAATLELYASDRGGEIPFWSMAAIPEEELRRRHEELLASLRNRGRVITGESLPGAGSVPGATIPSPNLQLDGAADELWQRLLRAQPPILARRREGNLIIDLRTVDPKDDDQIARALR